MKQLALVLMAADECECADTVSFSDPPLLLIAKSESLAQFTNRLCGLLHIFISSHLSTSTDGMSCIQTYN